MSCKDPSCELEQAQTKKKLQESASFSVKRLRVRISLHHGARRRRSLEEIKNPRQLDLVLQVAFLYRV